MRLISQDRTIDVPYERCIIQTKKSKRETDVEIYNIKAIMGGESFHMGQYTSQEKGVKVLMEIVARYKADHEGQYMLPAEDDI